MVVELLISLRPRNGRKSTIKNFIRSEGDEMMVETIGIGICPECGALIRTEKLEHLMIPDTHYPSDDAFNCPVCKKVSSRYQWDLKDFLVD